MLSILSDNLMKIYKANKTEKCNFEIIKPLICDIPEVILYQKVIDNILKLNNSETINYYQIVGKNTYC